MKHIKNSIKDGLFLLEHSGIPIAILTDFNENISNGSLCVDKTNQDLYILKSGAWVKYGSGFDGDTYIPLAGTTINKPVTGDIQFLNNKKLYSGESSISLSTTRLILGFSDNNNTTSNFSYIYDKNVILLKNDCIITIDSNSKNNFIDRVSTKTSTGLVLSNSINNYILSEIKSPLNMTELSHSYIKGNFNNLNVAYNSHLNLNINEGGGVTGTSINSNSFVDFSISTNVIPTQPISLEYNSNSKIRINNIGNILTSNNNYTNYIEGTIKDFVFTFNNYISLYGNVEKTTFNNNAHIYNLGHITNDKGAILFSNITTTSSNIENSYGVYNIGMLGAISIIGSTNTLFLGRNMNNSIISNSDDVFINTNGIETINNSFNNISINTTNRDFISSSIYSTIDDSSCNILFNNNIINMNSANNNFVVNVENVNMNGDNNFIFTPKSYNNAFTGTVNGNNNVIFSLDANKNYTINSNIFTFGTIYSTSGNLNIPNGNILLGNYEFNNTLTTNNIILGARLLTNINHGNQINNIFLNVDNFIVPDSNAVYLPNKFYSISGSYFGLFNMNNITNNRIWNMPDESGTVALLSDVGSVNLADFNDINDKNDTNPVTSANLPQSLPNIFNSSPNTTELYNGSILTITESPATSLNPYNENNFSINSDFRTWLENRFHERPIPSSTASIAVAYVLYKTGANSGTGSILEPFSSLSYALTVLASSQKSIIVLDSGLYEIMTFTSSINWYKNIELSEGVVINVTDNQTFITVGGNPNDYLFNAFNGFSISGKGSFILKNIGLVKTPTINDLISETYRIEDITIYSNVAMFKTTQRPNFNIINVKFNIYNIESVYDRNPITYSAFSDTNIVCNLFSTDTNFSRIYISYCVFNNIILVVNMSVTYYSTTSCRDSTFYASTSISGVSYITINNVHSDAYNFSSRNNTFDLANKGSRYAFNVNDDNCISVNDRIIRYNSGADMIRTSSFTMYFYNTIVQTSNHGSVPYAGINPSILIEIPSGLTII